MTVSQRLRRLSRSFQVGVICAFIIIGTITSARAPTWMPLNPGAATPTIVIGWPLTTIVWFEHATDRRRIGAASSRG